MSLQTPNPDYWLYVLMRQDLASMNPGKAVAHGAHAGSQFESHVASIKESAPDVWAGYLKWKESAHGFFGSTLTLTVNEAQMREAVAKFEMTRATALAGIVNDPTYPLRDGAFCHFIPLDTCAYLFFDRTDPSLRGLIAHLELMP